MSRVEVSIYNEATGFVITSQNRAGRDLSELKSGSEEWLQAVADGVSLPVSLVQDDGFGVRVVVDEPLTDEESSQWVDCWSARLTIPDGMLTISGGMEYLWGEEMEEYTEYIPVPPGEYRATFYTYIPSVNGWYCLASVPEDADPFGGGKEPLGAYFRRTRPGETFPLWLQGDCIDDPEVDLGHEEQWEDAEDIDPDDGPGYTDFLLHLTPINAIPSEELLIPVAPIAPRTSDVPGWVPQAVNPRKPIPFPIGLEEME